MTGDCASVSDDLADFALVGRLGNEDPIGRPLNNRERLVLRSDKGNARSSPSRARTSNAYSCTSWSCFRECKASKSECGLDDPRISIGPVVAIAGKQTNAIAIALYAKAIAVFVNPIGASGNLDSAARDAKLKTHGTEIVILSAGSTAGCPHVRQRNLESMSGSPHPADRSGAGSQPQRHPIFLESSALSY